MFSGSRSDFPGVDHKGRQACSVLISVVTQSGALVLRIAYDSSFFSLALVLRIAYDSSLFCKVPQVKNRLFPTKPLPL